MLRRRSSRSSKIDDDNYRVVFRVGKLGCKLNAVGENWELDTNQSVVYHAATQFTKFVKVWDRGFNWPVSAGFHSPKSKEIS